MYVVFFSCYNVFQTVVTYEPLLTELEKSEHGTENLSV